MLSFWAGGISSFPPCAREYRLLRRLVSVEIRYKCTSINPKNLTNFLYCGLLYFVGLSCECVTMVFDLVKVKATRLTRWKGTKKTAKPTDGEVKSKVGKQTTKI